MNAAPPRTESRADQAAVRAWALERLRHLLWRRIGNRPADVWLIGSMSRGDWVKSSDIDIAVRIAAPDSEEVVGDIRAALEDAPIPYFVDVIDLDAAAASLVEEVAEEGIPWSRPSGD